MSTPRHRWERTPTNRFNRLDELPVGVCIKCGMTRFSFIRTRFRHMKYVRGTFSQIGRTPVCDGVWPDGWKPARWYSMFLDDERIPSTKDKKRIWVIVRSYDEAVACVERFGIPAFISFDHDLGGPLTGKDFANWLVNRHLDGIEPFPDIFKYTVHSANPVGEGNIRGLLDAFMTFMNIQRQINTIHETADGVSTAGDHRSSRPRDPQVP
jgi:hypothetical protein